MPCHSPTKARVIFSLTRAVPLGAMEMVSLKSVTRQLRAWAAAGTSSSARNKKKSKGFTPRDTGEKGGERGELGAGFHDGLGCRDRRRSIPRNLARTVCRRPQQVPKDSCV